MYISNIAVLPSILLCCIDLPIAIFGYIIYLIIYWMYMMKKKIQSVCVFYFRSNKREKTFLIYKESAQHVIMYIHDAFMCRVGQHEHDRFWEALQDKFPVILLENDFSLLIESYSVFTNKNYFYTYNASVRAPFKKNEWNFLLMFFLQAQLYINNFCK